MTYSAHTITPDQTTDLMGQIKKAALEALHLPRYFSDAKGYNYYYRRLVLAVAADIFHHGWTEACHKADSHRNPAMAELVKQLSAVSGYDPDEVKTALRDPVVRLSRANPAADHNVISFTDAYVIARGLIRNSSTTPTPAQG